VGKFAKWNIRFEHKMDSPTESKAKEQETLGENGARE